MSFEENREKLNRYLKAIDHGDEAEVFALIESLFPEDYVLHTGGSTLSDPADVVGREALREHTRAAFRTFANMQHIIEDEFGDDEKLATRVRFLAVLKGEFLGVAAAGREIDCPIIYLHRFHGGKIQECWLNWDALLTVSARLTAASHV
jgi:predicted ester cyclase